jgi:hypothetical protein
VIFEFAEALERAPIGCGEVNRSGATSGGRNFLIGSSHAAPYVYK